MSFELLSRAGMPPSMTVAAPGAHGAGVTGIQGMGVRTPRAAAVAAATMGFDGDWHMPNGRMFIIGALAVMLAAGVPVITQVVGRTIRALGAAPKLHDILALMQTCSAIKYRPQFYRFGGGCDRAVCGGHRTFLPFR